MPFEKVSGGTSIALYALQKGLRLLKSERESRIMGGSSPQKPKSPPPSPAPVRADSAAGEQAYVGANRRQGLQKTINPANPLAPSTALGSIGSLGTGAEGIMRNTPRKPTPKPTNPFQLPTR